MANKTVLSAEQQIQQKKKEVVAAFEVWQTSKSGQQKKVDYEKINVREVWGAF